MTQFTEACGRTEERIFRNKSGRLVHLLPGEKDDGESAGRKVFRCKRRMTVVLPVGAANASGIKGKDWGGYCRIRCRLVLPGRYVLRHEQELLEGKKTEQILTEQLRKIIREEMEKTAAAESRPEEYGTMWERIRIRIRESLISEGWLLEEFRPGSFQVRGA